MVVGFYCKRSDTKEALKDDDYGYCYWNLDLSDIRCCFTESIILRLYKVEIPLLSKMLPAKVPSGYTLRNIQTEIDTMDKMGKI